MSTAIAAPTPVTALSTITIRLAKLEEYEAIGGLIVSAFSSVMQVSEAYRNDMRDLTRHASSFDIWVAESESGELLGTVLTPRDPLSGAEHDAYPGERGFRLLAVAPQARGLGVGRKLIDHAVRRIGALGIHTVGIGTGLRMVSARKLYESYGFVRRRERETYIVDGGYRIVQYTYRIPDELVCANPLLDAREQSVQPPEPLDVPGSIPFFIAALERALPGQVDVSQQTIEQVSRDRSRFEDEERAVAQVTPDDVDGVSRAVRIAAEYGFPIYARGSGTGLAGGSVPTRSGLVINLERLNSIGAPDLVSKTMRVGGGVITSRVNQSLETTGLWYAPDPASSALSTIGGNIATNAGGFHCVKYGVTRDSLLSLQVVLADGSVIETGQQAIKNVAGLDLTGLFTGSEGELGIVTAATLRLRPKPRNTNTIVGFYDSLDDAAYAVERVSVSGVQPSIFELLAVPRQLADDPQYATAAAHASWLLIVQTDGFGADEEINLAYQALSEKDGQVVRPDQHAIDFLFRLRSGGKPVPEHSWMVGFDAAVPVGKLRTYFATLESIARQHGFGYSLVSHVGDGNVHSSFFLPVKSGESQMPAALARAHTELVRKAVELGGTMTGEHGIGIELSGLLQEQIGERNLSIQRAIKQVLDPNNLLNPGKWL